MTTTEEKFKVLKMVEDGRINAEEAGKLMEVLEKSSTEDPTARDGSIKPGRWLKIIVTDITSGKTRVNIRLPISLISSGIKLGMKFAPEAESIDAEKVMDAIRNGGMGKIVDAIDDNDHEHVEIWVE
jgi:hypothetical protein